FGGGDPAVSKFTRRLQGFGTVCRDVNRNTRVEVYEMAIEMEKLNLTCLAAIGVIDRLTVEQRAHDPQVFPEFFNRHRILTEHPHCRVSGSDSEKYPAGGELIDAGDRMRSHRRDTGSGNRYPGPDLNPFRAYRRQRQGRVTVRPDHL